MTVIQFDPKRRRKRPQRRSRSKLSLKFLGVTAGTVVAVVAAALMLAERFPEAAPWLVEATAARSIEGSVTHVRDGDTIEVQGVPVRLGSVDCPEIDTQPGRDAQTSMQVLTYGFTLQCHLNGERSYDRWIGSCYRSDGQELGSAMIEVGYCRRYW